MPRQCREQVEGAAVPGVAISARNFFRNACHSRGVAAACPAFIVSTLGARLGNQTSYQFCEAKAALGTPRGGSGRN